MMKNTQKIILITGGSSGIGYDSAVALAKQGHKVYAAARRVEMMEPLKEFGIVPLSLDVTDDNSMQECVKSVLDARGDRVGGEDAARPGTAREARQRHGDGKRRLRAALLLPAGRSHAVFAEGKARSRRPQQYDAAAGLRPAALAKGGTGGLRSPIRSGMTPDGRG